MELVKKIKINWHSNQKKFIFGPIMQKKHYNNKVQKFYKNAVENVNTGFHLSQQMLLWALGQNVVISNRFSNQKKTYFCQSIKI